MMTPWMGGTYLCARSVFAYQLNHDIFRGGWQSSERAEISIARISVSRGALRLRSICPSRIFCLLFEGASARFLGADISKATGLIARGRFDCVLRGPADLLLIAVESACAIDFACPPDISEFDPASADDLRRLAVEACDRARSLNDAEYEMLQRTIRGVAGAREGLGASTSVASMNRHGIALKVEEILWAYPDAVEFKDLSVGDVGRLVSASLRSVQLSLASNFGVGFTRLKRLIRLQQANYILKSSGKNVTTVADLLGFGHYGRFAIDYKTMHGDSPSETRRRASWHDR